MPLLGIICSILVQKCLTSGLFEHSADEFNQLQMPTPDLTTEEEFIHQATHVPSAEPSMGAVSIVDMMTRQNDDQAAYYPNIQLHELLKSCFDETYLHLHGAPVNAKLTVKARDEFRDVELTFDVSGDDKGYGCILAWDDWLVKRGSIKSVHHDTGQDVPRKTAVYGPLDVFDKDGVSLLRQVVGITIEIYKDFWEITTFHPANLVSIYFVKDFIACGLAVHSKILGRQAYVRLSDMSPYRELSWLLKGKGRTFYEYDWNLEYECLMARMGPEMRTTFYEYSKRVGDESAEDALSVEPNRRYDPVQNAWSWENPIRPFSVHFKDEMNEWIAIDLNKKKKMNIRTATRDFINFYKSKDLYDLKQSIELAQNTFVFFLRQQREFDLLARQVISGYDISCYLMRGAPMITVAKAQQYEIIYYPTLLMHSMEAPSTSSAQQSGSEQTDGNSSVNQPLFPYSGGTSRDEAGSSEDHERNASRDPEEQKQLPNLEINLGDHVH